MGLFRMCIIKQSLSFDEDLTIYKVTSVHISYVYITTSNNSRRKVLLPQIPNEVIKKLSLR